VATHPDPVSAAVAAPTSADLLGGPRRLGDKLGDPLLWGLAALATTGGVGLLVWIAVLIFHRAAPAISHYGLHFLVSTAWDPVTDNFGAADFIFGTAVSSALALVIAAPVAVAIALYLTELAPRAVRRPVAILVELLAAIPSVVLGLWGILVLGPFLGNTLEPALNRVFGWIPLFSGTPSPYGMLNAALILTIMTVPIVTAVTREIFETTPGDLKEGAYALGCTRWEMVRMVILPYGRAGITGAVILGLGRALGEAIAVTQVIGNTPGIHRSLFAPAGTLAAQIASEYQGATTHLQTASLVYLAAILLVLSLIVNIVARLIVRRTAAGAR
jgi:phosphate transport system permease protein